MSTTITDKVENPSEGVAVPLNLIKAALGITGDFDDVEFDTLTNAVILYRNKKRL